MTTNNSTLENAIARAGYRGFTVRETKAREDFPYQLVGPACTLDGLCEIVDLIDRGSDRSGADRGQSLEARRAAERVIDLQIQLGQLSMMAGLTATQGEDVQLNNALYMVEREAEAIQHGLDAVIEALGGDPAMQNMREARAESGTAEAAGSAQQGGGAPRDRTTIEALQARAAHLVATSDGGPTFTAELEELARDIKALAGTPTDGKVQADHLAASKSEGRRESIISAISGVSLAVDAEISGTEMPNRAADKAAGLAEALVILSDLLQAEI